VLSAKVQNVLVHVHNVESRPLPTVPQRHVTQSGTANWFGEPITHEVIPRYLHSAFLNLHGAFRQRLPNRA